ncbi:MAG: DUF1573 domain-containing protein [Bacteroidota bacterium]
MKNFVLVVAMICCVCTCCLAQGNAVVKVANLESAPTPTALAEVNWPSELFDFGTVAQGEKLTHTFYFENTGSVALKIEKVKPSCGCTATDYSKEAILPGEKGQVTISYDAKKAGVFTKSVTIFSNALEGQKLLRFRGEVAE